MSRRAALVGAGKVALAGALACALTWQLARSWPAVAVERATLASVALVPLWTGIAAGLLAWRWRARRGAARRQLFALHRGLGGALALAAMLVFGSGVGAVLDRSLTRWQLVHEAVEVPEISQQPLDEIVDAVLAENPALVEGELAIHPASAAQPWVQVDFSDKERNRHRLDFDPRTGEPRVRGVGPLWVLRELHKRLLVSPWIGEAALGLVGLLLALILLAGLATRRDWVRDLLRRRVRAQPLSMRLHQWIGLGTLPAALLWAWSGAMLGFTLIIVPIVGGAAYDGDRNALMREVLAVDRPPKLTEPAPRLGVQATIAASCPLVREQLADAEVHRVIVRHPGLRSGGVRVDVEGGLLQRGSFHVGADGALRDCRALPAAGVGLQAFMATIALHYGEWGAAWAVDLAYVTLGAALFGLAWLGGSLLARRRERDGDARGAERARRWLYGVGLAVPLASATLLLLSRVPAYTRDESLALTVFVCVMLGAVMVAHTRARRVLVGLLVASLLAIPIVGWSVAGARPGGFEAVLIAVAIGLVLVSRVRSAGP